MKKLIFIDIHDDDHLINDGGSSRAIALRNWLRDHRDNTLIFKLPHSKMRILKNFAFLLRVKNAMIFYIHPEFGFDVFKDDAYRRILTKIYFKLLQRASKCNELIFDINDLKYEQSIDLELTKYSKERIRQVEDILFSVDAKWIFASESMRAYECEKYHLNPESTEVCVNGSYVFLPDQNDRSGDTGVIKCVYAGTLNKGRNIEKMIETFPSDERYKLILMGTKGDWIKDVHKKTVEYLGALPEKEAKTIVAGCDIGLIPYDDSRMYYNIAYPTKLPFYVTAGIPVLSTPVTEVMNANARDDIGWCAPLENWGTVISGLTDEEIEKKRQNAAFVMSSYTWDAIFSNSVFLNE